MSVSTKQSNLCKCLTVHGKFEMCASCTNMLVKTNNPRRTSPFLPKRKAGLPQNWQEPVPANSRDRKTLIIIGVIVGIINVVAILSTPPAPKYVPVEVKPKIASRVRTQKAAEASLNADHRLQSKEEELRRNSTNINPTVYAR